MSQTSGVTAEIRGFSEAGAMPKPWKTALEQVREADKFWFSTVRPDGRSHVTPLIALWHDDAIWFTTDPERLQAVADRFTAKYGTATWHCVVRDGALSHAEAGRRALVFSVRPVRGLEFRKDEHPSQTTWTFPS